jgi:hypothetical protein
MAIEKLKGWVKPKARDSAIRWCLEREKAKRKKRERGRGIGRKSRQKQNSLWD